MNTKEKLTEIIGNVVVNDKGNRIRDVFHPEFVQKIVEDLIKHNTIVPPCKVVDAIEIETIRSWLYEMAINNVGCAIDGDFSVACEEIISRLDGLRNFAREQRKGGEGNG